MLSGESGICAEDWDFELDTPYIPALQLPHAILKRICSFLPTQGDKRRACLVHPVWSPAATDSLWQEPVFKTAAAFQGFYKAVHVFKRLALRVQALNIVHDPYSTNTDVVKRSSLQHHSLKDSSLAKPEVILALVKLCENITSLQIYGWQIRARHIESLSTALHGLRHLTIIGDSGELLALSSSFRNLLSKLTTLRLDGVQNVNARFMDLLDRKCNHLQNLQLTVQDLGSDGFEILTFGKLPLRELVLTDCSPLEDVHVAEIARAYPQLQCLVLDGAEKLTGESLAHIFERCHELEKLDLRVNPNSDKRPEVQTPNKHLKLYGKAGELRVLSLHGICLDTITVQSNLCGHSQLREITLQSCKVLCDDDFRLICQSSHYLESIRLVDCPSLTGRALPLIARSNDAKQLDVAMIRCGPITSQQLKQFCQGVTEGPSRKLVISQARELAPSEYANHASTDPMTQEPVYVFDKEALQSLAQMTNSSDSIDDGEHLISQRTYTLNRRQVALVAEQLGIPSQQLRAAISKVLSQTLSKKPSKVTNDLARQTIPQPFVPQPPCVIAPENEPNSKASNRISFKKDPTPAIEPVHGIAILSPKQTNQVPEVHGSRKESPSNRKISIQTNDFILETTRSEPVPSPIQSQAEDLIDSSKKEDAQKIVFKYQPLRERNVSKPTEPHSEKPQPPKEEKPAPKYIVDQPEVAIQLGGWGVASSPTWGESPTTFTQSVGGWDATAVERMTWQAAPVVNAPIVAKGERKKGAHLFLPATSNHDGWGQPPIERVAWDDDQKQGFAHDIIESQQQTVFWKLESGVWKKLSTGEQREKELQMQREGELQQAAMSQTKPRTFNKNSPLEPAPITRYTLDLNSSTADNGTWTVTSQQGEQQQKNTTNELSDDDDGDDISDSDDGVTIKTSAQDRVPPPPKEKAVISVPDNIMDDDLFMDYSDPSFSTAKTSNGPESPPSHPGNPQWISFDLWKKTHQASNIEHPEASQNACITVDQGTWDDKQDAATDNSVRQIWSSVYDDDTTVPVVAVPVASYKLVDIIDNFNETMSTQSTHSRTPSDAKWEAFESSMGSYQSASANDQLQQASPNRHEATVEYIKAQAETRQSARNDVIRQTETDLISSPSSFPNFETDERHYISNAISESSDSKNADDDWISSSTSDTGFAASGLGISTKVSRRPRNKEPRQRISVRHPMRPEQMAGQWGSFPIDDTTYDDTTSTPNVSSLINVDLDESFANEGNQHHPVKSMPNLTSAFSTQEEPANDKTFTFYEDSSIKANMHQATEPSSITNDLATLNNKNQDYGMNTSDNGNSSVTHSTDNQASNEGKPETSSDSYFFDGLMNDASNKFPPMAMPVTLGEVPKNVEQDTTLKTASPTSHATGSPSSSTSRVVLSVKIETMDAGTQPLVIMENDDPKAAIHDFCNQYGMADYESKIADVTLPRYKEKMAKRLLGRASRSSSNAKKNPMASPSLKSPSPSMDSLL